MVLGFQDQFCVWLSLVRLPTAREFFSEPFSKKETTLSFFFLLDYDMLLVPVQCLDKTFLYLSFAQSCNSLSKSSNLSAILKHRGKNFVMMTSIVHLSSKRSKARINQNARITWIIIHSKYFPFLIC